MGVRKRILKDGKVRYQARNKDCSICVDSEEEAYFALEWFCEARLETKEDGRYIRNIAKKIKAKNKTVTTI